MANGSDGVPNVLTRARNITQKQINVAVRFFSSIESSAAFRVIQCRNKIASSEVGFANRNKAILHRDIARPRIARAVENNKLRAFHSENLSHSPYAPDITPSDSLVFSVCCKAFRAAMFPAIGSVRYSTLKKDIWGKSRKCVVATAKR